MGNGMLGFVGRTSELTALRDALGAAKGARGSGWLLSGEAGIGKSRLVEEAARDAERTGFHVLWGRCWEAGGAPAFWPWIQIVREALRHAEAAMLGGARASYLVQLVPELRDHHPDIVEPPQRGGEQAQFSLLDAVSSALCAASRVQPLVIALDDLHVATPSSLLLFDFLAQHARTAPIMLIGTFRPAEVRGSETEQLLHRLAQTARTIAVPRLSRDEMTGFLRQATGHEPGAVLIDTVVDRTEGNPLFLVELCRLMVDSTARGAPSEVVPPTLRTALQRRLAVLSPTAREVLEQAATVGRDFFADRLVGMFALSTELVRDAIDEGERAAIVAPAGDGSHRFTHILLREVLHQDVPLARRQALHLRIARWLETYGAGTAVLPWSEIAHHYFAAGDSGRDRAIDATERAAQEAGASLAFAEAIASYRLALQAVDSAPQRNSRRRTELMIGLGHAQLHGGDAAAGRDTCLAAAALALELGAADLLARAALELGSVMTFAHVDPVLVSWLEIALEKLGDQHPRLRARVMARLAAALQPSESPRGPVDLALEAVELARTTKDRPTLLATLSSASSTMVDVVEPAERLPLDREHVTLARALGDRVEELRGYQRIALAAFEIGDLTSAHAAIASIRRLADGLQHPFYAWRGPAAEAALALWEGRFADAERLTEEAHQLGTEGGDPNVRAVYAFQTTRLARLTGRRDRLRAGLVRLRQLFAGTAYAQLLASTFIAANGLQLTSTPPTLAGLDLPRSLNDRASIESVGELAAATGDRELAARTLIALGEHSRCVTDGVIGMTWSAPIARVRALCEQTLGRLDDAIASMERAIAECRELGGRPMIAWTAHELAVLRLARGRGDDMARADALLVEAEAIARELDMASVLERVDKARMREPTPRAVTASSALQFELVQAGELWTLTVDGAAFQLRDTKGLRYLARLVAEPRRELHVLDLGDALDTVDAGDAGELLDPKARDAYRERVRALEDTLADAEQRNDLGAAERANQELEFLQAELGRALGLGGRARRAGAAAERARINVQRRLRSAIAQIATQHPTLGRHLERSLRTGVFCCYEPE